mmetsp:Transcript_23120/g.35674  ORF Transcript_23120/g.35674 Transcript_23120/m.35674 type:complete len:587 (+) Transcript_23120:189-1949(+)|eukprot:CAMPEP_0196809196 /NCGR_PEP_ID=MMETSP1362-20130617/9157_1 /TAXON_ID=163516 /ORGANISM="Leptocylindrus danicus, Strain CCMP1856" /LENGTH=586 /DNA_ID=CAMNT_0042183803 /DNA_START=185 /DNA_END=1945 /DNA_ORIENTATION=-
MHLFKLLTLPMEAITNPSQRPAYIVMLTVSALVFFVPYCGSASSDTIVQVQMKRNDPRNQPPPYSNNNADHTATPLVATLSSHQSMAGWTPLSYPNPMHDPAHCRVPASFGSKICDPDELLTDQAMIEIAQMMERFNAREVVPCSPIDEEKQPVTAINYNTNADAGSGTDTTAENMPLSATASDDGEPVVQPDDPTLVESNGSFDNFVRSGGKHQEREREENNVTQAKVQVAVAVMRKMDVRAILNLAQYYEFEDISDAEDEAARYFAAYLRDVWDVGDGSCKSAGVLLFLSVDDSICYISPGRAIQPILSGWRLEDAIDDAKPLLRHGQFRWAIEQIITEMENYLSLGPPLMHEWLRDFLKRYGLITAVTIAMFCYAAWNEHIDRYNKRLLYDVKSKMSTSELRKARSLQRDFREYRCPICLCYYQPATIAEDEDLEDNVVLDVPTVGSDGLPLKLLRCGHTFDETCWKQWVMSGKGDVSKCPMCRQDVRGPHFDSWQSRSMGSSNEQRPLNDFGTQTTYGTNARNDLEFDAHPDHHQEGIETSLSPDGVSVISFGRDSDLVVLGSTDRDIQASSSADMPHLLYL